MAKAKPVENAAKNAVSFRFYDNRQKYLLLVTTGREKTAVINNQPSDNK